MGLQEAICTIQANNYHNMSDHFLQPLNKSRYGSITTIYIDLKIRLYKCRSTTSRHSPISGNVSQYFTKVIPQPPNGRSD